MRIFKLVQLGCGALLVALGLTIVPGGGLVSGAHALEYAKPKRAFEDGIRQYRAGDIAQAIKALEYAANKGNFRARFYLAQIYAKNSHPYTNHKRSFEVYREIVDQFAEVDPVYNLRAPYVARAIVELARYLKSGVPAANQEPDYNLAASYLDHAAKYFGDREAQYELSKMYLAGEGLKARPKLGMHWISTLARDGHAEAQGYLGDLFWRGKYIKQNKIQGMAYIMLALDNAQPHNRVGIEELYQHVYCRSSAENRRDAAIIASNLRKRQLRKKSVRPKPPMLGIGDFKTTRSCRNGEPVEILMLPQSSSRQPTIQARPSDSSAPYYGSTSSGFGLRNVGSTEQSGQTGQ